MLKTIGQMILQWINVKIPSLIPFAFAVSDLVHRYGLSIGQAASIVLVLSLVILAIAKWYLADTPKLLACIVGFTLMYAAAFLFSVIYLTTDATDRPFWSVPMATPKSYVSKDGTYTLSVKPTDYYGFQNTDYVLKKNGAPVWQGQLPMYYRDIIILPDGRWLGWAYRCVDRSECTGAEDLAVQVHLYAENGTGLHTWESKTNPEWRTPNWRKYHSHVAMGQGAYNPYSQKYIISVDTWETRHYIQIYSIDPNSMKNTVTTVSDNPYSWDPQNTIQEGLTIVPVQDTPYFAFFTFKRQNEWKECKMENTSIAAPVTLEIYDDAGQLKFSRDIDRALDAWCVKRISPLSYFFASYIPSDFAEGVSSTQPRELQICLSPQNKKIALSIEEESETHRIVVKELDRPAEKCKNDD